MNKELEEAIKWLSALDIKSEYEATNKELILNYIENSIPKENVEEIIKRWKEKDYIYGSKHLIKVLQELLEGK